MITYVNHMYVASTGNLYLLTSRLLYMNRIADELSRVKDLLRTHPQGMSITDIAAKLGKNKHSVGRYLDILHASGHVDLRTFGMAKVFTLSSRVPLSALLSYSTDLVMVVDQQQRVIQINEPFLALVGLDQERVVLQEVRHLPAPDPAVLELLGVISGQIEKNADVEKLELGSSPKRFFHLRIVPTVFDDGSAGTTILMEDISEAERAKDEIIKSREFFSDMIANMTDGLLVKEDGEFLFINDRAVEITGYSREELKAIDPVCLAEEKERLRFRQKFDAVQTHLSTIQDIRFWAVRKDGESRYLNVRMSANQYGEKCRHYILVTDMTGWRRREEEQELQWTIMRTVVDQFPHPICCYGEDGRFFLANDVFCSLFSCHKDRISGEHLREVMPPDICTVFTSGDEELRRRGGHEMQNIRIPGTGTVPVWCQAEKSTVTVGDGGAVYFFCVILTECPQAPAA